MSRFGVYLRKFVSSRLKVVPTDRVNVISLLCVLKPLIVYKALIIVSCKKRLSKGNIWWENKKTGNYYLTASLQQIIFIITS